MPFLTDFDAEKGGPRVPQGRRFGSQNGAKIDFKTGSKFKSEKSASRRRLGAILSRFLGPSGRQNVGFYARIHRVS